MTIQAHENLIAEFAALNTAVIKCFSAITHLAVREGATAKAYLEKQLQSGEEALAKTNYWDIPEDRREAVIENARARYAEIIDAVYRAVK